MALIPTNPLYKAVQNVTALAGLTETPLASSVKDAPQLQKRSLVMDALTQSVTKIKDKRSGAFTPKKARNRR